MSKKEEIREKALEILGKPECKTGLRWAELIKRVSEEIKENINTCSGSLYNLPMELPEKVSRPQRGLFILKENEGFLKDKIEKDFDNKSGVVLRESDIYEPAKGYLIGNEECTHAVVIGGSIFGKKWGTPDILGAIRAESDAIYRPPLELIAVEIKDEGYSPVEALGQAMAYKLFAHRTWLVLPEGNDLERIEGIAISANIGLISFMRRNGDYEFTTLNRPITGHPDFNEVNNVLSVLKQKDKKKYNELIKNENC